MPFIPAGATPAQLDQFARRLAHHLSSMDARTGLMSVQNAFARAGGYPDRHAAEASAKATRYFFNPLQALGQAPGVARSMPVLMGVKAHKLLEWGKHAWKKQRAMLSKPTLGVEDAQALLADAWSHPNWAAALIQVRQGIKQPLLPQVGLKMAPTLEQLAAVCTNLRGGNPNFSGLHTVLGYSESGDVIGLDVPRALTHVLAIDDDPVRRHATARRWITQRVRAGDRVLLMDGSDNQAGARAVAEEAALCGRPAPVMIDIHSARFPLPGVERLSAASLTELVMNCLMEDDGALPNDDYGRILSWVSLVCLHMTHVREDKPITLPHLIYALGRTPEWVDWSPDENFGRERTKQADEAWKQLPAGWPKAYEGLTELASTLQSSEPMEEAYTQALLDNHMVVFQLPSQTGQPEHQATARLRQRLVIALYKGWLASHLGRVLEPEADLLAQELDSRERRVPTLMMFLDVPLGGGVRGGSVLPAQSRALGCALVHVGPASSVERTSGDNETAAWLANMNTKIVYGTGDGLMLIAPNEPWVVETNQQRAVVMCGSQTMGFTPYTD